MKRDRWPLDFQTVQTIQQLLQPEKNFYRRKGLLEFIYGVGARKKRAATSAPLPKEEIPDNADKNKKTVVNNTDLTRLICGYL